MVWVVGFAYSLRNTSHNHIIGVFESKELASIAFNTGCSNSPVRSHWYMEEITINSINDFE